MDEILARLKVLEDRAATEDKAKAAEEAAREALAKSISGDVK